jgi:uncharacterized protein YjiS (DUF1127 family)
MSCGSRYCNSTNWPRVPSAVNRASWFSLVLVQLGAMLDKSRRQQLWFELEKARQRGLLNDLEDWQLRDLGLSRNQARREARKPFWK